MVFSAHHHRYRSRRPRIIVVLAVYHPVVVHKQLLRLPEVLFQRRRVLEAANGLVFAPLGGTSGEITQDLCTLVRH